MCVDLVDSILSQIFSMLTKFLSIRCVDCTRPLPFKRAIMKSPPNCTLDYNAASFNHLLLERTSRKWLLVRFKPLVILSDTVQSSSPHPSAWHKIASFPSKLRFNRGRPLFAFSSCPSCKSFLLFFSFGDAPLVKFLKASFGNFVSRWTVPPSAPSLHSLLFLFYSIARDDAIIGGADTRRPRKITIIPPGRL